MEQDLAPIKAGIESGDDLLLEGLWNTPKACVAALSAKRNVLILTGAGVEEARLFHDFSFFSDRPIIDYPAWETLPNEKVPPSPDIVGERYQVLQNLSECQTHQVVISSLQAALQKVIIPKTFDRLFIEVKVGQTHDFQFLVSKFEEMGYTRATVASDKGEYAYRGGILDIYPVSSPDPVRIEFFGDEIDSMRLFDPVGQKSVEKVSSMAITPAIELELLSEAEEMGTLLDFLGSDTLVIFDDLLALEDRWAQLLNTGADSPYFLSIESFLDAVDGYQKIYFSEEPMEALSSVIKEGSQVTFEMFQRKLTAKRLRSPFIRIEHFIFENAEEIHLIAETDKEMEHLKQEFPNGTHHHKNYLSSGFALQGSRHVYMPSTELTHRYKIRRQKQRSNYHTSPEEVYALDTGDMVVHLNNGIGQFIGTEKRPDHNGISTEFMVLEYAKQAKLFVPLHQSHLVSKYVGKRDEVPKAHTLGSKKWQRTRITTEKAIAGYAKDLLDHYAHRIIHPGFPYPEDSTELGTFESEFPFVETEDQLRAVTDIKGDMELEKPMDRLVCGDVGYGKTEVAMRAAFKAVYDGSKQVAVLVPTTVLALQHYETFVERMRYFPIRIALMSRFRTTKENKESLEKVAKGEVDILIGTHLIVSKYVQFKDLGLVVIDEEQKFGVRAKEHLKKIRKGVDSLTLSATPIPRTLYMSLVGVRDMSVINTPPQERLPIKSIIAEPTDALIKNACMRELARDGQVFYIHNRVESLPLHVEKLRKLLPQARIVMGHGQMNAEELDSVFHTFKEGKADILVCTTIVENGVDIPNANTILIDRADTFGLAELYQLRGRVGRWNRRAFAYFLIPSQRVLSVIARRRLEALVEASGFGGGMKLAMRDLEIRGAGDLLGTEQSGHVSAVGFHLYCKLLKRTIQRLQGKLSPDFRETKMEFPFDARLPEDYINAPALRMEMYQRLAEAVNTEQVDALYNEMCDRFGPPPESVEWLYRLSRLRVVAAQKGIEQMKFTKNTLSTNLGSAPLPDYKNPAELEQAVLFLFDPKVPAR